MPVKIEGEYRITTDDDGNVLVREINPDRQIPDQPSRQPVLSNLDYMERFTDAELAAIYTAAKTSVVVEVWLEKFKLATEVNLDDPRTVAGVQALEALGILAPGRAAEILA